MKATNLGDSPERGDLTLGDEPDGPTPGVLAGNVLSVASPLSTPLAYGATYAAVVQASTRSGGGVTAPPTSDRYKPYQL